ncbi:hypothetical protein ACP4OV_004119 [Aristida adscensionis]
MDLPESELREYIHDKGKPMWTVHNNHKIKCFKEDEIRIITSNYTTLLGKGAFGEVYRGVLDDNSPVAVKRYISNVKEDFAKEVIVHCEINHRNVVRLIGYCIGENALLIVTECLSKGNLSDILHSSEIPVSLETRLEIAIGCAEALSYMHSQMYGQVIHGDIKPANILLDENLNAKISDFGISKLISTDKTLYTTHVMGSIGYMDPLFARTGRLTSKSDVYSFGVVLLELISRRKAIDGDGKISLAEDFTQAIAKRKKIREFFDVEISDVNNLRILEEIGKLAAKCLAMEIHKRPEMKDVAERLRMLKKARYQRQERTTLFGWVWRSKTVYQNISAIHNNQSLANQNTTPVHDNQSLGEGSLKNPGLITIGSWQSIELEELLKASAEVLGKGTCGTTYKAVLENGFVLAVKRLRNADVSKDVFNEHVTEIGAVEHEHILPLRGYYFSKDEKILLYDFLGGSLGTGSLSSYLHGNRSTIPVPVGWETRSAIALSAARAVAYIHSTNATASHGNIKSTNILLTSSYEARVSEHGINALVRRPTFVPTYYTAPEVEQKHIVSQKADVYSFGVILLELLTRVSPIPMGTYEGRDLPAWVVAVPQEQAAEVLDEELRTGESGAVEEMLQFLKLGIHCCKKNPIERPSMSDVARRIAEIRG